MMRQFEGVRDLISGKHEMKKSLFKRDTAANLRMLLVVY
jgi:hypothetical protein